MCVGLFPPFWSVYCYFEQVFVFDILCVFPFYQGFWDCFSLRASFNLFASFFVLFIVGVIVFNILRPVFCHVVSDFAFSSCLGFILGHPHLEGMYEFCSIAWRKFFRIF